MKSKDIRKLWINFFESKKHLFIESKPLIPKNDKSILWINSGVATLKEYFSGQKISPNPRLVNIQKCIRTNDIENVGRTSRHHTLFEMLGNFSIGDYFKEEAIKLAYEFIFDQLKFNKDNIYITYFSEDKKTYQTWLDLGIDSKNLIKGERDTNFWDLGQGPCGPCTEIFYDRGEKFDFENQGIKLLEEDLENDRYIEIWNIVFSEFNNDGNGEYQQLKQKNIDTGAGLERIASIMQGANTNFDTDLFLPIIKEIEKLSETTSYDGDNYFKKDNDQMIVNQNYKVIADHIRASICAINDGAIPSNTQRGYVIRRLIRRAYRAGKKIGINEQNFLSMLIGPTLETLSLEGVDKNKISLIINNEENIFSKTIVQGEQILKKEMEEKKFISSSFAFTLFETYGYPLELTKEIVEEKNIEIDLSEIDLLREKHRDASRTKTALGMKQQLEVLQNISEHISEFIGYDHLSSKSKILVSEKEKELYYSLFDKTPFYATSGGQKHDYGKINETEVINVFKDKHGNHWHVTESPITTSKINSIQLQVDENNREYAIKNHSATHLLGAAISEVMGEGRQLGSENNADKLRIDIPAFTRPVKDTIQNIEDKVNEYIKKGIPREYIITTKDKAIEMGALSLEEGEYKDVVRVVVFGNVSKEFCGGTHVDNTKKIEKFKIINVESKGSGKYRFEAITSNKVVDKYEEDFKEKQIQLFYTLLKNNQKIDSKYEKKLSSNISEIIEDIEVMRQDNKSFKKNIKKIDFDFTNISFTEYKGHKAYINLDFPNISMLKKVAIDLRESNKDTLIIIGAKDNDKQLLAVSSHKINCKQILDDIFSQHNGSGGGQEKFAMGSCQLINDLK